MLRPGRIVLHLDAAARGGNTDPTPCPMPSLAFQSTTTTNGGSIKAETVLLLGCDGGAPWWGLATYSSIPRTIGAHEGLWPGKINVVVNLKSKKSK